MSWIGEFIIAFIWWILLLPLFMLLATPFILVLAMRGEGPYFRKVGDRYSGVLGFWKENAWALTP